MVPCFMFEAIVDDHAFSFLAVQELVRNSQFRSLGSQNRQVDTQLFVGRPMVFDNVRALRETTTASSDTRCREEDEMVLTLHIFMQHDKIEARIP